MSDILDIFPKLLSMPENVLRQRVDRLDEFQRNHPEAKGIMLEELIQVADDHKLKRMLKEKIPFLLRNVNPREKHPKYKKLIMDTIRGNTKVPASNMNEKTKDLDSRTMDMVAIDNGMQEKDSTVNTTRLSEEGNNSKALGTTLDAVKPAGEVQTKYLKGQSTGALQIKRVLKLNRNPILGLGQKQYGIL